MTGGYIRTGDQIGWPDGIVSESRRHDLLDVSNSRVGGRASYPKNFKSHSHPQCRNCGQALFLVTQLHCPLETCIDRVNYLWGCNVAACALVPGSWAAYRLVSNEKTLGIRRQQERKQMLADNAVQMAATQSSFDFQVDSSWTESVFSGFATPDSDPVEVSNSGVAEVNDDRQYSLHSKSTDASETTYFALPLTVSEPTINPEEIPNDKKWNVAPSTPKTNTKYNELKHAFSNINVNDDGSAFTAHYIAFDDEYIRPKQIKTLDAVSHLDRLLLNDLSMQYESEYQQDTSDDFDFHSETYENTVVRGLDRLLRKFLDRVEENPEQVVRYRFNGVPLHFSTRQTIHTSSTVSNISCIPACERCGSERVFEYQVFSTVLSTLSIEQRAVPTVTTKILETTNQTDQHVGMEFGTILVYTCKSNCSLLDDDGLDTKQWQMSSEVCVVQLET